MTLDALLRAIRSRGYWRTVLRPLAYAKERIPDLSTCRKLITDAKVSLRNISLPFVPSRDDPFVRRNFIEYGLDSATRKEVWRVYQSGQFVHYFAIREDLIQIDADLAEWNAIPLGTPVLDAFWSVFSITERYELAARLAQKAGFSEGMYIEIGLYGTQGRVLVSISPGRDLYGKFICSEEQLVRGVSVSFEALVGRTESLALNYVVWLFEHFNWFDPPKELIADVQRELLEQKA